MSIPARFSSPISSPRIALACAILWAATFVSSTYFPQVFEAEVGCEFRLNGAAMVSHVRVFGHLVAEDEESSSGFDAPRTRAWRWRVTVAMALVGAVLGVLIGGHRWWRWRPEVTGRRWPRWAVSISVFLVLAILGLPWTHNDHQGVFSRTADAFLPGRPRMSPSEFGELCLDVIALALVAAVIGWAAHTVIMSWGLWPWGRPTGDQAADYDDRTSPFPRAP